MRGGLGESSGAWGPWSGGCRGGRRGAGLNLGLELGHLLWAGQCLQQGVLLLQLGVTLNQLLDLLLQDLHLLSHGVHQVTLHQVLRQIEITVLTTGIHQHHHINYSKHQPEFPCVRFYIILTIRLDMSNKPNSSKEKLQNVLNCTSIDPVTQKIVCSITKSKQMLLKNNDSISQ